MVLILVMAGVVGPSFSTFLPAYRVQKAADVLVATAGKAHADSVLTLRRYRLYFVTSPEEEGQSPYTYLAYEEDPLREPGIFRKLVGVWGEPEALPQDVTFETLDGAQDGENKEKYYDFNPDGTATEATITVAHPKGDRVTIKIDPTTARISIEEAAP